MLFRRLNLLFGRSARKCRNVEGSLCAVDILESRQLLSAVTVQVGATRDSTIYKADPDTSNGRGEFIVTGNASRGLVYFDVGAADIPDGSTVIDAVLSMSVAHGSGAAAAVSIHRLTTAWGEAGSNAIGDETTGAGAHQFDATWLYSFFDGEAWNTPGGDYSGTAASTSVGSIGTYEWMGGGLIDDVQSWVDNSATNFGWLIRSAGATKGFASRDAQGTLAPTLEITFEAPPAPRGIVEGRIWNDLNVDGKPSENTVSDLGLSIFRDTYFDAFGGEEYWFRSSTNSKWYFLTSDGALTQWSGTGGELTGSIVTHVDPRFYHNPSLMVQGSAEPEPWLNGRTVELVDNLGSVVATTVTTGRDLNRDGRIDPDSEGGWYRFNDVPSDASYSVRQVLPTGWNESARIQFDLSSGLEKLINGLNLQFKGSYFEDFGGIGEKWIRSPLKGWHYITPSGDLFRWNSRPITSQTSLQGTLVASLAEDYFQDPSRMFNGRFRESNITEGDLLFRVDFGTYETQTVSGRVWLDFYDNGIRESMSHLVETRPDHQLAEGEEWFYDKPNDAWFIINVDGEATFFATSPTLEGGNKESGTLTPVLGVDQVEPWLNGRTVELLNTFGQVVATTLSRSIDLNEDGKIQYETERGHYRFENVRPGQYTIRTVTGENWLQTSPITSTQSRAISLDAQYGFSSTGNDFFNWGQKNERWLIDAVGRWYFMTPDGSLYHWHSGTGATSELSGNLITKLSVDYYNNLTMLTDPDKSAATVKVGAKEDSTTLLFGNHKLLGDILGTAL